MKKVIKFYQKMGFIYGMVFTICLSSLVSIAATNLPGFFTFSPGGVISSSEINNNFEKLAGNVVLKVTSTPAISIQQINGGANDYSYFSDSPTSWQYRKKISFDSKIISDSNFLTAADPESTSYSSSAGANFDYYQVPTTGWYEVNIVTDYSVGYSNQTCTSAGCNISSNANINILIADSFSQISYTNTQSMDGQYRSKYSSDINNTGTFVNTNTYNGFPPTSKKIYLKAGQILYIDLTSNVYSNYATADYLTTSPPNPITWTIIKY